MGGGLDHFRLEFLDKSGPSYISCCTIVTGSWESTDPANLGRRRPAGVIGGAVINRVGMLSLRYLLPMGWNSALDMYIWMDESGVRCSSVSFCNLVLILVHTDDLPNNCRL